MSHRGALTVGVGGALLVVRHQMKQRREDQEALGIRASQKMTWEEKVQDVERKAKENMEDKEQRARDKLSGTPEDVRQAHPISSVERTARDTLASAERKMKDTLSAAELKTRVAVGKEK